MHFRKLRLERFMAHDSTELQLPASGVVVVCGPNGSGKSSIAEAAAVAAWGRTLRGTPWWRADGTSAAEALVGEDLELRRTREGGKPALWWAKDGESCTQATATKAQQALAPYLEPYEVWRRTRVFSSHDAAHFSGATDAQRKQLIETLLGLDRFDGALKACRGDLKTARMREGKARQQVSVVQTRLEGERKRLADLDDREQEPEPPEPDSRRLAQIKARRNEIGQRVRELREQEREVGRRARDLHGAGSEARARLQAAQQRLKQLDAGPRCTLCGQEVTPDVRQHIHQETTDAERDAHQAEQEARQAEQEAVQEQQRLEAERLALMDEDGSLVAEHNELERTADQRARWEREQRRLAQQRRERRELVQSREEELLDAEDELDAAQEEVAELEAAEAVLGYRGVRAHVLDQALQGIEQVANAWLARIFAGVSVRLRSQRATQSGTEDAITVEVDGLDHGHGYRGASGGERRRIDVALLLALAEVAGAAHGAESGTLFFDEVFDALDSDGIHAVAEVLGEIGQHQAVVVVTHVDELARALPATLRLRAEGGTLAAA